SAAAVSNLILQCTLLPDPTSKSTYPRSGHPVQQLYQLCSIMFFSTQ
ncbi:hypothetical protein A2U01_0051843, partial [Trifolium medium]|nr:hypothetical protein [Trifolium medium]